MCVRINKYDGKWILNVTESDGHFGCFGLNHDTAMYEQIELRHGAIIENEFPMTLGKISFEVRNSYDPWLEAMVVTEGTFNFGMSSKELRFLGIGLILCCGGLLIQPCFWIQKNFCWGSSSSQDPVEKYAQEIKEYSEENKQLDAIDAEDI